MATTPFLGCKISLISKSEIRYEGILYTIDPKESTIALAKVRSYGTEDRPVEKQVAPREEIFEYIIFRAGDIKDLIVDDPPASIAPGLADPAIIQAHSTSTSGATFPSTNFPQMTTNSNISATSGQRSNAPAFNSAQNTLNSLTLGTNFKSNASNESRSQNSTPTGAQQHRHSPHLDSSAPPNAPKQNSRPDRDSHNQNQRKNMADKGGNQYRKQGGGAGAGGQQPSQQNYSYAHNRRGSGQQHQNYRQNQSHSQPPQTNNRFGGYNNRQYNNYSNNSGTGGQWTRRPPLSRPQSHRGSQNRVPNQNRLPKEPIKFDKEFDFEKGLEEFSEMEKKLQNLKLEINANSDKPKEEDKAVDESANTNDGSTNGDKDGADDHFYDKTKSFFDSISCEALEREKGNVQRIDWKAERKLNSETFGVPLSYRRMNFGRGGRRGYGGYRSNRGGGGFGRGGGGGDMRRFKGPQPQPQYNRNN